MTKLKGKRVPGALLFWGTIGFCVGAIMGHPLAVIVFTVLGLAHGNSCRYPLKEIKTS